MTFSGGNAMQDNTNVPQGPLIVASGSITRLKAEQALKGEEESAVHKEVH